MFCLFCRDALAQGLKGKYDYLDGITLGKTCLPLRQAFTSWEILKNPGRSHFLSVPGHVQRPRAPPFLLGEYDPLIKYLEQWGAVCIGSLCSFVLEGMWLYDDENNDFCFRPLPKENPSDRYEICKEV